MENEHLTVENLIESLGEPNWYLLLICLTILLSTVPLVWDMLMMALGAYTPEWHCLGESNSSLGGGHSSNCSQFLETNCTVVFEGDYSTVVTEWNLICDRSWSIFFIISLQMSGVFLGSILGGYLADAYGRKKPFFGCLVVRIVCNIIIIFSNSWVMFGICRLFLGILIGASISVGTNYSMEFAGQKARNYIIAIPHWSVTILLIGFMIWLSPDWKHYHIAGIVLSVPFLLCSIFVPESIRWLTVKGRIEEAQAIVKKIAEKVGKPVPDMGILYKIAAEERKIHSVDAKYTYLDLFKRKEYTKKTLLILNTWFWISSAYYGLSFSVSKLSGDLVLNLVFSALVELPKPFLLIAISKKLGRRWSAASTFGVGALAACGASVAALFAYGDTRRYCILGCYLVIRICIQIAWGFVAATTAEQYPTVIRNLGFGAANSMARLGSIFSSVVLFYSQNTDYVIFIVSFLVFLVCAACMLMLEETQNLVMQDTIRVKAIGMNTDSNGVPLEGNKNELSRMLLD